MLRVEWLRAAASDCPSWATSIRRVCSIGTRMLGSRPRKKTEMSASTGCLAAKPKSASMTAIAPRMTMIPRSRPIRATRPDRNAPAVMPMP